MSDDAARAYAILGLRQGASLPEVRRRYRFLAQRWHPDRHAGDSRSEAEATDAMRRINGACERLVALLGPPPSEAPPLNSAKPPQQRLSREAVDGIVRAIGSEGPIDWLLSGLGWVGGTLEGVLGLLFAFACAIRLAVLLWRGNLAAIVRDPDLLTFLGFLVVLVLHELLVRRRAIRASAGEADRG